MPDERQDVDALARPLSDNLPLSDTPETAPQDQSLWQAAPDNPCDHLHGAASADPLVAAYLRAARADSTRRAYEADLRDFERWGGRLPSTPDEVARYLAQSAAALRPVTLRRHLAALASAHHDGGFIEPTKHSLVRRVMQGIERRHAAPPSQVAPLMLDDLAKIVAVMGHSLIDIRDRAVLLVGFFGALRRSEIVALDHCDVQFGDAGIMLSVRKSKTDQLRRGRSVQLPRMSPPLDPAAALREWLDRANAADGPIFRSFHGRERLSDRAVARIVKKWAAVIGLEAAKFSGHSLRAGFATSAALAGFDATLIARQTGHKTQQMVAAYVRPQW